MKALRHGARRALCLAGLLALLGGARAASANGAFPDEFSVHFPSNGPHRIYLGANFGLIVSEDDGATWRYACEPWVTAGSSAALSGANVSFYQLTADGAVLAQATEITRSDNDACSWPASTGVVTGLPISDIFADPNDASFVIAVIDQAAGTYITQSHDGGRTFVNPPLYETSDLITGIEISRSAPSVIYATTISASGGASKFLRSADGGKTWAVTTLPSKSGVQPVILQIDPEDADTVYLRYTGGLTSTGTLTDDIAVTTDGGHTFNTILTINSQFSAFLRAGDGALYAGSLDNLYVKPKGAASFTSHKGPHFRCLGQRPGTSRIFACGDLGIDGFSLGYSDDNGATFHRMMDFTDILGPLTCEPLQTACQAHWARIKEVLGIGAVADGGTPDAGTPDAGGTSDGGTVTPPKPGGSHCATGGAGITLSVLGLLALLFRRYSR